MAGGIMKGDPDPSATASEGPRAERQIGRLHRTPLVNTAIPVLEMTRSSCRVRSSG
jgi:hypothetical protein